MFVDLNDDTCSQLTFNIGREGIRREWSIAGTMLIFETQKIVLCQCQDYFNLVQKGKEVIEVYNSK